MTPHTLADTETRGVEGFRQTAKEKSEPLVEGGLGESPPPWGWGQMESDGERGEEEDVDEVAEQGVKVVGGGDWEEFRAEDGQT